MSIRSINMFNPDVYAAQYASKNNMSVEDAKETLKTQYGDPSQQNVSLMQNNQSFEPTTIDNFEYDEDEYQEIFGNDRFDFSGLLQNMINFFSPQDSTSSQDSDSSSEEISDVSGAQGLQGQDPDTYAQEYADEHGISLEEAKEELKAKYGDPQQR